MEADPTNLLRKPLHPGGGFGHQEHAGYVGEARKLDAERGTDLARLGRDAVGFVSDDVVVTSDPCGRPVLDLDHPNAGWANSDNIDLVRLPSMARRERKVGQNQPLAPATVADEARLDALDRASLAYIDGWAARNDAHEEVSGCTLIFHFPARSLAALQIAATAQGRSTAIIVRRRPTDGQVTQRVMAGHGGSWRVMAGHDHSMLREWQVLTRT